MGLTKKKFKKVNSYALRNLAIHLHNAGQSEKLYRLLISDEAWMQVKFAELDRGDEPFVQELELAISDFVDPLNASQLILLSGLYAAKQVVDQRTLIRNDVDLRTLTLLGNINQALSYARLRANSSDRFDGLLVIYQLVDDSSEETIRELVSVAHDIQSAKERSMALRRLAFFIAQSGKLGKAQEILIEADNTSLLIQDTESRLATLNAIAETLASSGSFERSGKIIQEIRQFENNTDEARHQLVISLARSGRFDEALEVLQTIQGDGLRVKASRNLAVALAQNGYFTMAFSTLETRVLDEFLQSLAELSPAFEKIGANLSVEIFQETIRIVGWVRSDWRNIYLLLTEPENGKDLHSVTT